ncbi:hypothetical protein D3C80_1000820 [compost metagenome]|jgi:hypothetical protein
MPARPWVMQAEQKVTDPQRSIAMKGATFKSNADRQFSTRHHVTSPHTVRATLAAAPWMLLETMTTWN